MKKILSIALALAAMAGCQQDEIEIGGHPVAAQFTDAAITRATGTAWEASDAIGVYMLAKDAILSDANVAEGAKNIKHTVIDIATGTFVPATASERIYFPTDGSAVDFYAYYPHQTAMADGVYKIDVSNQSAPAAIDLMTARTVNQTKAAPNVALTFAHQLSKLSLTLMAGDGFIYADLVGMTVTVMGLPATADYNIATGAISGTGAATPIPTTVNTAGAAVNATAILIPQKGIVQGSVQVFFNLADGTKLSWSLPATTLTPGNHYQYKLSISLPGVTLISQNIIDWKTNIPETGIANRKYFAGDYYPDPDVTFSAPGVVQSGKAPVGIVIWIDPAASGLKGKIMSLDEGSENWDNAKLWRSAGVLPQAMTWDAALMGEYWEIYKTWNGSYEATINNTARNAFNQKLTDAGSTAISAAQYWSSDLNYGSHQYFDFALGRNISISLLSTKDIHKVRNVAAF